ncbi:MAG: sugar kinase [Verrucomicrobiaceae bacterium]|nr:sugar kinase [Verrucomicrobiaceae bacterium]
MAELLVFGSIAYDCIETPIAKEDYILGGSASYAALAASYFAPVKMAGIVGCDFKDSDISRLKARNIDVSGLEHSQKPTFFWRGKYHDNFNSRDTLDVQLNAFEGYSPILADSYKNAKYVLLGNISPEHQSKVLSEIASPKFVVLDTMDLWINTALEPLKNLIKRVNLLIVNDSEAKALAQERNIIRAGEKLLQLGAESVIIKTGEYGAMLFHKEGFFVIPAFPVVELHDPTGAGDSFVGALTGYLAGKDSCDFTSLKQAMVYGAATASLTVESFSCYKLEENGFDEVQRRADYIKKISQL